MTSDQQRRPRRPRRPRRSVRAVLAALPVVLAVLSAPYPAAAQQILASNRFNFDFSNPGARSLGFGGAFAALADDATAAFANPAGLVQLGRPEVSFEVRSWDRSPSFVAGGRISGTPTGRGIDTVEGLVFSHDDSSAAAPSFAAVVLPRGAWSFAIYGHRLARFEIETASQGFFDDDPDLLPPIRSPAFRERVHLDVVSAGFAAARRMSERLSVGLALVHSGVSLATATEVFFYDFEDPESAYEEIPFTAEQRFATERLTIDDEDWTVQAGVLWRATDRWSTGLFYRQGPETKGRLRAVVEFLGEPSLEAVGSGVFSIPDVFGGGAAYRSPGGAWTVAAELDQVGYQGLLREEIEGEDVGTAEYEDAWEAHLGVEYAVLRRRPILAFRLGGWQSSAEDVAGGRIPHVAVGLGVAAERFQVDLAADFSEQSQTASISFIYGF